MTSGGRVLCVTALGKDVHEARERAYGACDKIRWDGKFCRRDIGLRHGATQGERAGLGSASAARGGGTR